MRVLLYFSFLALFFNGILALNVYRNFNLLPDAFSALLLVSVILRFSAKKDDLLIPGRYIVLAFLVFVHILAGLVLNEVAPTTFLNGLRPFIKWIPFFLVPFVFQFSEDQLKSQCKFVLLLCLVQLPVAVYQRFVSFADVSTGDVVTGTLGFGMSGHLSQLLLSVIAVIVAFYARNILASVLAAVLALLLFFPTTINETKLTLLFLPLVLFVPLWRSVGRGIHKSQIVIVAVLGLVFSAGFVVLYDYTQAKYNEPGILQIVGDTGYQSRYLFGSNKRQQNASSLRTPGQSLPVRVKEKAIGKGDTPRYESVQLAVRLLADDIPTLWFGLGVGNTLNTSVKSFAGAYAKLLGDLSTAAPLVTVLLLQTGVGGLLAIWMLFLFILIDTYRLSDQDGFMGALACGWIAVAIGVIAGTAYNNLLYLDAYICLFAYFSGHIAASLQRARRSADFDPGARIATAVG